MPAPDPANEARARAVVAAPAAARLGLRMDSASTGTVRLSMPHDPAHCTLGDIVHGGVIATLADVTGVATAICGAKGLPQAGGTSGLTIAYLAPAVACDLTAEGTLLKGGRRHCVARVAIRDPQGVLVAEAQVTVAFA